MAPICYFVVKVCYYSTNFELRFTLANELRLEFLLLECLQEDLLRVKPFGDDNLPFGDDNLPFWEDNLPFWEDTWPYGEDNLPFGEDTWPYGLFDIELSFMLIELLDFAFLFGLLWLFWVFIVLIELL